LGEETGTGNDAATRRHGDAEIPPGLSSVGTESVAVPNATVDGHVAFPGRRVSASPGLRVALQMAGALTLTLAVMGWIEFGGPAILDNDGYYHIRWATIVRQNFPHLPAFKALPLTTLNEPNYVDHHYLFHVLLIPFTFGDLRMGAKLAAVVFSSLGIVSLFGLLVSYRVRYGWLWLAPLVASSEPFLYRMSMTRAPALSLALLGVGAYLILKRKHPWLALLSFVFVWSYSLFPLMLAFAGAYSITVYLSERRIDLWGVLASAGGIAAGLVINPYFPKNLALFREHLLMKTTASYSVDVGVEWYPYETWVILGSSALAFAIYFAGLLAFEYRERIRDAKPLFFLIVSTMFLLMAFKSRRFVEYWPPFAVVFAAFTITPRLERVNFRWLARTRDRAIAAIAAAVIAMTAIATMGATIWQARDEIKAEADPFAYRGASEWIAANTAPGSMIFNTDWDDFPMLFHYNPNNAYIVGLDPTYLYDRDAEMWKVYADITLGKEENPAPLIRGRFGAEYVFTDSEHSDFMQVVEDSGDFEKVYEDKFGTVLRVRRPDETRPKKEDENAQ
jgi:asparagine N-glycosylation enzyme membrane subunit Stt3